MTHKEARRKLGSRSTRRSGVRVTRGKSGAKRAGKPSVALLTWALVEGRERPVNPVPAKVKTDTKAWQKRNVARLPVQTAYAENLQKAGENAGV